MSPVDSVPSLVSLAAVLASLAAAQEKEAATVPAHPSLYQDVKSSDAMDAARVAEAAARDAADLAARPYVARAAAGMASKPERSAAALRASGLEHVVYDTVGGEVWAVGQGWKARFGADGLEYIPRLGKAAPRNFPTRFELDRVTVGGEALTLRAPSVRRTADGVALHHGPVSEVYHAAPAALEQTFVFEALPGLGDLVLDVAVASAWAVVPGEDVIRFVDPAWGEVTYGRAFALDAAGARVEIAREWTGDGIRMTVPATFLAGAVLPLTVDPIIGVRVMNNQGVTDDDFNVDGAWDASSNKLWYVWQDYVSATDADIFAAAVDTAGVISAALSVEVTNDYWDTPAIAASPTTQRLMVVASATTDGPGSSVADIAARLIDPVNGTQGAPFVVDAQTQDCVRPDVGGSFDQVASSADFCVVYERVFSATDHDILARVVNTDGTFLTGVISLSNSGANNDFAPAISKSRGNETFNGDYWNIAWIRDVDGDGRGAPMTQRVYFNGTTNGSVEQLVMGTLLASNVDVTSTFDQVVAGTSERPYIVAFQREVGNGDIYATVCAQNLVLGESNVSEMEDFDASLIAGQPSIATDGTSFFLAYEEYFYNAPPGGDDFDVHALSGGIWTTSSGTGIALAERRRNVGTSFDHDATPVMTSMWDGGAGTIDDAWVLWVEIVNDPLGEIWIQRYDSATLEASTFQAIGSQYCAANGHADSYGNGRASSFISARGNASTTSTQQLYCDEMKLNAFAYFIVSTTTGDVNNAGGGQGRLCLGGTIGRLVGGSILNTGNTGSVTIGFNPQSLPTPNGTFAAAPGQTLYFQCWHRDTAAGGVATSNFSNACAVTFRP